MLNINIYKELIKDLNEENYEFICIYAETKEELVTKLQEYFSDEEDLNEEEIDKMDIEGITEWEGPGFYDYVGRSFQADTIAKIDTIVESELDGIDVRIFTDERDSYIAEYKKDQGYKFVYGVFGVILVGSPDLHLQYIVYSDSKVNPLSVLEDNDIDPYIFGTNRDGQWGNFTSIELSDMDEDDLYEFFREINDAEDFYVEE